MPDVPADHDNATDQAPPPAPLLSAAVTDELTTSSSPPPLPPPRKRRVWLPLILLILSCFSTFWVGASRWWPQFPTPGKIWTLSDSVEARRVVLENWEDGLIYMACLLGILLTHEMGHFLATVWYRVPASFPYVIPLPFTPLGTLGAVISMDARRADRKQTFDIGLAGPLAGLVVAVPILIWGIMQLDLTTMQLGPIRLHNGLLIELVMRVVQPPGFVARWQGQPVTLNQLNPYFMAGWVGMLITGLNMMPVSQLDGGHVIYTLFGPKARWIARGFMMFAIFWCISSQNFSWVLMLILVLMIGVDHPPTRDDRVPIGWFRFGLGLVSLVIPILCFAPVPLS